MTSVPADTAGPSWRKSSYSFHEANCVQVAELDGRLIGVRDSKDPGGPMLAFEWGAWWEFVRRIRTAQRRG